MNFHEYQAKQLFADYGIAVPAGRVARTPEEAVDAAKAIGGDAWMVKAQIHAGGRGKAGGVKYSKSLDEVREYARGMLGTKMATYQTAGVELPVDCVLVTQATDIAKELYLSVLVDRASQAITFITSSEGGVDIETVARETPEKIQTLADFWPLAGFLLDGPSRIWPPARSGSRARSTSRPSPTRSWRAPRRSSRPGRGRSTGYCSPSRRGWWPTPTCR